VPGRTGTAADGRASAYVFAGSAILLWGGSFHATALAGEQTSAVMLAGLRAAPAAVVLVVVLALLRSRLPGGALWPWAAVTGLFMVALPYLGAAAATVHGGAANAAVIVNSSPFFVLVLAWVVLGERIPGRGVAGLVVAFAGVVLMISSQLGGPIAPRDLLGGVALGVGTALAWAVGTMLVKRILQRDPQLDVLALAAGQHVVSAVVLVAVAVGSGAGAGTHWTSGELWLPVSYLAIGSSATGYLLFFAALQRADATRVSAWIFLVPVVAVAVELVLGALPGVLAVVGMLVAIVGVALTTAAPRAVPAVG